MDARSRGDRDAGIWGIFAGRVFLELGKIRCLRLWISMVHLHLHNSGPREAEKGSYEGKLHKTDIPYMTTLLPLYLIS
jgi:hypothetical protein